MADFLKAWALTDTFEGGYANDPDDSGGETYRGISRVNNPDWSGWFHIDQAKMIPDFPDSLKGNVTVDGLVMQFYKGIWDSLPVAFLTQRLAEELFDITVNMGKSRAIKLLQEALNTMNRNQTKWPDILVDGVAGPVTKSILHMVVGERAEGRELLVWLVGERIAVYKAIMRRNPEQEKFASSWARRISI